MHQLSTLGKIMKPVSSSFRHTCSYSGGETRFWRQINWSQNGSPVAESFGEIWTDICHMPMKKCV